MFHCCCLIPHCRLLVVETWRTQTPDNQAVTMVPWQAHRGHGLWPLGNMASYCHRQRELVHCSSISFVGKCKHDPCVLMAQVSWEPRYKTFHLPFLARKVCDGKLCNLIQAITHHTRTMVMWTRRKKNYFPAEGTFFKRNVCCRKQKFNLPARSGEQMTSAESNRVKREVNTLCLVRVIAH